MCTESGVARTCCCVTGSSRRYTLTLSTATSTRSLTHFLPRRLSASPCARIPTICKKKLDPLIKPNKNENTEDKKSVTESWTMVCSLKRRRLVLVVRLNLLARREEKRKQNFTLWKVCFNNMFVQSLLPEKKQRKFQSWCMKRPLQVPVKNQR